MQKYRFLTCLRSRVTDEFVLLGITKLSSTDLSYLIVRNKIRNT